MKNTSKKRIAALLVAVIMLLTIAVSATADTTKPVYLNDAASWVGGDPSDGGTKTINPDGSLTADFGTLEADKYQLFSWSGNAAAVTSDVIGIKFKVTLDSISNADVKLRVKYVLTNYSDSWPSCIKALDNKVGKTTEITMLWSEFGAEGISYIAAKGMTHEQFRIEVAGVGDTTFTKIKGMKYTLTPSEYVYKEKPTTTTTKAPVVTTTTTKAPVVTTTTTKAPVVTTTTTKAPVVTTAAPTTTTTKVVATFNKKATPVVKLSAKKRTLTVKLKKAVAGAKKYQVKYATNKKLKKAKTKTLNKTLKIKKLAKKTYYVKVRAVSKVNGKTVYGKWSKTLKVKVK